MFRSILPLLCVMLSGSLYAADMSSKEKISYTIGHQMALQLKSQAIDIDIKTLQKAIEDVMTGKKPALSMQDMQKAMQNFRTQMQSKRQKAISENAKKSAEYLRKNAKQKGVTTTSSGLQYKVAKKGKGKKPSLSDKVKVHYHGTLIDGTVFDSSVERGEPVSFPLSGVIKGWQEALQLMPEGSKYTIYVPPALAYGERGGPPKIGPNEALIFDIELLAIESSAAAKPDTMKH